MLRNTYSEIAGKVNGNKWQKIQQLVEEKALQLSIIDSFS